MTIHVLHRQGMSCRAIADELQLSRNTVNGIVSGKSDGFYGPRKPLVTKLQPHHDYIRERLLQAYPERFAATALLRELRQRGYDGGISQLKKHLASLRPSITPEPIQRFEIEPGHQMQMDFVVFRRGEFPLCAFTATLGYSRMSTVIFTDNERAETWASCIEQVLEVFGGVPKSILCDNAKSVVIERHAYGEGKHRLHPLIWDIAKHYGIRIHLCRPYRAQTKGKIERFHRYLRQSFFVPLQSRLEPVKVDVATANSQVQEWLAEVANVHVHATLHERPCDRYEHERSFLQALPLPYSGVSIRTQRNTGATHAVPVPIESIQHDLETYELFAKEIYS